MNPFIDEDGILRVGGRLEQADLPFEERHPAILPSHNEFVTLLIDNAHRLTLHGGVQLVMAHLRNRYWILHARRSIKCVIHKCVTCFRHSAKPITQLMGNLPTARLEITRPFTKSGIDYAGPIEILVRRSRGRRQVSKGYICLFVCLSTKAIHLELVSDMTAASFISAFHRFGSRRGYPTDIYSDNGTNFVGASNQIDKELQVAISHLAPEIAELTAKHFVTWHFIPPASPNFGGLWEAGVKSTKHHLKRIVGKEILLFEEMNTVLIQIEGCLNSRPLCPMTSDPNDLSALTPAHFLIGEAITSTPRPSVLDINVNRLDRFQLMQRLTETFWKRWRQEYLSRLQQRPKWIATKPNIEIGDLVLVKNDNMPPSHWLLCRVTETTLGGDGLARVATIKTATTSIKRSVSKLCRLPVDK